MTIGGWITFTLSVSIFTIFFILCIKKVLSSKAKKMVGNDMFKEDFFKEDTK